MREYLLYYLLLASMGIGVVGFTFMMAAFVMIAMRGGWQKAMQADSQGPMVTPPKTHGSRRQFGGSYLGY